MRRRALAVAVVAVTAVLAASTARASDDPDFSSFQYGPQQIYAPEAWTVSRGEGVTIAIVDSGVQLDHPDLRDKIVTGYDFADDDDEPSDEIGHGTHVAGIAAATTDNGIGMAGVAPASKIMPIRVPLFGSAGSATIADSLLSLEEAVRFAVQNGAKVINLSLGEDDPLGPEGFDRLSAACLDAYNSGSLCVAAAGNSGAGKPSGYSHDFSGIVVAANDRNREIAGFSQKADTKWSVTAPGVSVHSTWLESGYRMNQGTSMAAPHVSGVAALLFAMGMNIQQVIDRIIATAVPLNDGGGTSGAGLVNAAAAVGAEFTPVTAPPRASTTTTVAAAPTGGPSRPSPGAATATTLEEGPVVLEEGVIEEDDEGELITGESSEFDIAVGDGLRTGPISTSDGLTPSFVLLCAGFVVGVSVLGIVARPLVLRRGIGRMRERGGIA